LESNQAARQPISISAVVDVVGALASGSLGGNLYLLDTNRDNGSTGAGTETLRTRVQAGDRVQWSVFALECEAYAAIADIVIDRDFCEVEKRTYPGTDVTYWAGTVKKDDGAVPYDIKFTLGTRTEPVMTQSTPFLVSGASTPPPS
jgi:hypothetical protein